MLWNNESGFHSLEQRLFMYLHSGSREKQNWKPENSGFCKELVLPAAEWKKIENCVLVEARWKIIAGVRWLKRGGSLLQLAFQDLALAQRRSRMFSEKLISLFKISHSSEPYLPDARSFIK